MSAKSAKITDLVKAKEFTYSFELIPNDTLNFDEIDTLKVSPAFFSITWHSKVHGCSDMDIIPLKLAEHLRSNGKNVCMHLSCDMMKKDYLNEVLQFLQDQGICNLFIILGEAHDAGASDFQKSGELIEYIRQQSGDYFCIGVAGYPEDLNTLNFLKRKVIKGANFIYTQAITDFNDFKNFVKECEKIGITIPILPGIGQYLKELAIEVMKSGFGYNHLHLYTMNRLDTVEQLIMELQKNKET